MVILRFQPGEFAPMAGMYALVGHFGEPSGFAVKCTQGERRPDRRRRDPFPRLANGIAAAPHFVRVVRDGGLPSCARCVGSRAVEKFASGHWVMAASSLAECVGCVLGDLVACPGFVCGVVLDEAEGFAVAAGLFPSVLGPGGVVDRFGVEAAGGAVAGALLACPGHGV